ncbi:Archaeophage PsiM2, terminase large subunit [uncultured Caudovirales phage]|uniref:Archaeophage PsiM2, terminase large subunit n=1 Tax=uncultured Caudovirales phage TaxID=2100421 RepID=A0A6J5KN92_9CAUD|nr:Archaeophage PsiM2, terminase large subunit [uncultured Caudovirales phage]
MLESLSLQELNAALLNLKSLPEEEQASLYELIEASIKERNLKNCRENFLAFVEYIWPAFICGPHHRIMAEEFQKIADGKNGRLALSLPPRSGKSMLTSVFFPLWYLGKYPDKKLLQTSHKGELAVGFGRQVRDYFDDPKYKEVFPEAGLKADNKASGRWATNQGGSYYAVGVGAGLAGFGADLCLIDDPHNEQEAIAGVYDPEVYNKVYEWYLTGPRQRLQPGARVAIISTRWSKIDLIGRVLADSKERGGDKFKEINIAALLNDDTESYWPEYWPLEELLATKRAIVATGSLWRWNAQYMQSPVSEEGSLIKGQWWNFWDKAPPKCEFIIQAWDTASRTTQRSNYSVCTTWGIFYNEEKGCANIILLDCWRDKVEFPELKRQALSLYREWEPDSCVIEQKSAGEALITEFRRMGLYVEDYTPTRGDGDKVARVNAITDIFASGVVYTLNRDWTPMVLEEAQAFPMGANDDIVDTIAMALSRFRRGNFLKLDSDEPDFDADFNKKADYY